MRRKMLTVEEAGELLAVRPATVVEWVELGVLEGNVKADRVARESVEELRPLL
jgi:hypothetical protein